MHLFTFDHIEWIALNFVYLQHLIYLIYWCHLANLAKYLQRSLYYSLMRIFKRSRFSCSLACCARSFNAFLSDDHRQACDNWKIMDTHTHLHSVFFSTSMHFWKLTAALPPRRAIVMRSPLAGYRPPSELPSGRFNACLVLDSAHTLHTTLSRSRTANWYL